MTHKVTITTVLCLAFFLNDAFGANAEILFPGKVQGVDLPNDGIGLNGEPFLALYKIDGRYAVGKAVVSFGPSSDSGTIEIVSSKENTITLFRNTNIRPGDVQTAVANVHVSKNVEKMSLGSSVYSIRETSQGLSLGGPEGQSIIISNRVWFRILWAGDLDRDGRLDLIVSSEDGDEKNSMSCLLLSSIAEKGKLVKEAACQFYSG